MHLRLVLLSMAELPQNASPGGSVQLVARTPLFPVLFLDTEAGDASGCCLNLPSLKLSESVLVSSLILWDLNPIYLLPFRSPSASLVHLSPLSTFSFPFSAAFEKTLAAIRNFRKDGEISLVASLRSATCFLHLSVA